MTEPRPDEPRHEAARALHALRSQLDHLEAVVAQELDVPTGVPSSAGSSTTDPSTTAAPAAHAETYGEAARSEERGRSTIRAEERWPVALAVVAAIALQLAQAPRYTFGPRWLLPAVEGAVLVGVVVANPRKVDRRSQAIRVASTVLVAFISFANGWSTYELIRSIVSGSSKIAATSLLGNGAAIYLTNVIVFALWYWEGDGGGPVSRAERLGGYPAFLFPQMTQGGISPADWQPSFVDYLYTSYTNATAFSPTDTMPLLIWAKLLMLLQSAVSLVTVGLVVARAVNIL